jgi:flagellar basal body-associated protein FliL
MHRINMLLQSKSPSELATLIGKQKLADDIKAQVEFVLGLRKTEPKPTPAPVVADKSEARGDEHAAAKPEGEHAAAEDAHAEEAPKKSKSGVAEVLFTSFIIQ